MSADGSDLRLPAPGGCRWCGVEEREHMQRWKPPVGWHAWVAPTLEQRKERMRARRGQGRRPGADGGHAPRDGLMRRAS